MIAWDNMKSVAHAVGTVNYQNRTFDMTANEQGGQKRTAKITGSIRPDGWLVADINGPNVNCKEVVVQWFVPPPSGGG